MHLTSTRPVIYTCTTTTSVFIALPPIKEATLCLDLGRYNPAKHLAGLEKQKVRKKSKHALLHPPISTE